MTEPYFDKRKRRKIIGAICILASILIFAAWLFKEAKIIHFDWSFTLPAISLVAALVPVMTATVDWFDKKMVSIDNRLDALEPSILYLKEQSSTIKADYENLRYFLLRQEAKLEQVRDNLDKLPKLIAENKRLIKRLEEISISGESTNE
ncbi:MAG: hypothetical protein ABI417_18330 [Coleofasciculaceae cyanobacterium]